VIICKKCGHHNEDRDEFCASCGAFLEWSGERVVQPAPPVPQPDPEPAPPPGFVERVRQAVGLEGQRETSTAPGPAAGPGGPAPPPPAGGWVAPASLGTGNASSAAPPVPPPAATDSADLASADPGAAAAPAQPVNPAAREPQAVSPAAQRPRAVPRTTAPAGDRREPGDLICGQCGTGNRPTRHFCQRCGASLAEVPVVRTPWYRRLFKRRQAPAASDRPTSFPTRGVVLATMAAVVVGSVFAYAAVPGVHRRVSQGASRISTEVRRAINPTNVPVRSIQTTASSELAGHPASFTTDLVSNDYWAADTARDPQPTLAFRFAGPTDLDNMLVRSGAAADYAKLARPRTVQVTYSDGTGQLLTLKDEPQPTSYGIHARQVSSLTLQITGVYPGKESKAVAIAEVELFRLE
jgi:hypothetical protein